RPEADQGDPDWRALRRLEALHALSTFGIFLRAWEGEGGSGDEGAGGDGEAGGRGRKEAGGEREGGEECRGREGKEASRSSSPPQTAGSWGRRERSSFPS